MGAIRRHPKTVVATAVVGVLALTGVAIAAILLSTSLTGQAAVDTRNAADKLTDVSVRGETDMTCAASIIDDGETLQVDATTFNVAPAEGQETVEEPADTFGDNQCVVRATLENVGDVPLWITGHQDHNVPAGWDVQLGDVRTSAIQPGQSVTSTLTFTNTNENPEGGSFNSTLTTSTEDPSS